MAGKNNQKKTDFVWGEKENGAFEELKRCLCSEPVLIVPDMTKEFIVTTDASDFALEAVLGQGKIGEDKVLNYVSRFLRGAGLRYSTYDCELLAIVFAKDLFRPFLYGRKFTIVTDHEPLTFP